MRNSRRIACGILLLSVTATASANHHVRNGTVASAEQEVTATTSDGSATVRAIFERDMSSVRVLIRIRRIVADVTRIHFHCARAGSAGGIVFGIIDPGPATVADIRGNGSLSVTLTNDDATGTSCPDTAGAADGRAITTVAGLWQAMRDGLIYFNVHTGTNPGGELRAQMR